MLKSRPMTLVQGPEFLQTLSRGTFASKFSPRATQGQITSYCETRRVLVPPASACRSSYIILSSSSSSTLKTRGLITLQTLLAIGQVCRIKRGNDCLRCWQNQNCPLTVRKTCQESQDLCVNDSRYRSRGAGIISNATNCPPNCSLGNRTVGQ